MHTLSESDSFLFSGHPFVSKEYSHASYTNCCLFCGFGQLVLLKQWIYRSVTGCSLLGMVISVQGDCLVVLKGEHQVYFFSYVLFQYQ